MRVQCRNSVQKHLLYQLICVLAAVSYASSQHQSKGCLRHVEEGSLITCPTQHDVVTSLFFLRQTCRCYRCVRKQIRGLVCFRCQARTPFPVAYFLGNRLGRGGFCRWSCVRPSTCQGQLERGWISQSLLYTSRSQPQSNCPGTPTMPTTSHNVTLQQTETPRGLGQWRFPMAVVPLQLEQKWPTSPIKFAAASWGM